MINLKIYFVIVFLFLNVLFAFSKTIPLLEREVTLTLKHERIEKILLKIEEVTKVKFSYASDIFSNHASLSIDLNKKTVREALSILLPNSIVYVTKGNYIILKKR